MEQVHKQNIHAYEMRQKFEGPAFWRTRAEVLRRGGMPKTIQTILKKTKYSSPETVRILDFGCGGGYKNDLIVESVTTTSAKKVHIVGCDIFDKSPHIQPKDPRASFEFKNIAANNILEEFGPNSFDVVTGIAVHHHLNNIVDVTAQVHAILKPGGIHMVADNFCWNGNAFSQAASKIWIRLYRWCEGNGFYNQATSHDVVKAHTTIGFKILGQFSAPIVVEGIVAQKCSSAQSNL